MEPSWNLPRTTPHPRRNWWNPWWNPRPEHDGLVELWWKPGGTLVEPQTTSDHPAALAEPGETGGNLVEPSWNLASNHPDHPAAWNPGGTLAEPSNPQPSKKLVEPWWNPRGTLPQTTPDHPALAEPGGTLVEPWWNPGGTLVKSLVEPWWNLSSGLPRTTPEPIWAETPKLSAVGE